MLTNTKFQLKNIPALTRSGLLFSATGLVAVSPISAYAAVGFSVATQTVAESAGIAHLTIERTGATDTAASVRVLITHGTATEGTDFTGGTGTVTWSAGENGSRTIDVTLVGDNVNEGSESIYFAITDLTGDTLGQDTTALIITDNTTTVGHDSGLPREQQLAGQVLDNVCTSQNLSSSAAQSCSTFQQLTDNQQAAALATILPRYAVQQTAASAQAQTGSSRAIQQRIQSVRTGTSQPGQTDISGLQLIGNDGAVSMASLIAPVKLRGANAGDGGLLDTRWGAFLTGQVQMADQDSTTRILGYQSTSTQLTGGVDYRLSDKLFFGTAMSVNGTSTDSNADNGTQDSTIAVASVFGNYYIAENFYLDGMLSYGSSQYDTKRKVKMGAVAESLKSNTDGSQTGLALSLGYDKNFGAWQTNAYGRTELNRFNIDGYREKGDSGFALGIGNQSVDSTQTALGASVAYVKPVNYGVWVPKLTAEWVHEYNRDATSIDAYFLASPDSGQFTITSVKPDQNFFNVGWSIAGTFAEGRSAFFRYEAQLGRADYISEIFEIGGRISF